MYVAFWMRAAVGLVFVTAAAAKMLNLGDFKTAVSGYRLVALAPGLRIVAPYVVPVMEMFVGIALASALISPWIAGAAGLPLLVAFTVAAFDNARHGLHTSCGCGVGETTTSYVLVVRNLVLLVGSAIGVGLAPTTTLGEMSAGAAAIAFVYVLAALAAIGLTYLPSLGEEMRHQLSHVR